MKNKDHISVKLLFSFILLLGLSFHLEAQDIETLGEKKIVKVSGGVGVNQTFYTANGIENRRDPYFWLINANLNFNFFDIIQAPFSFSVSQQNKNFSQPEPFNRFGISPKYRSVTLHAGHRSLRFSDYTLGGNIFLGAGIEIKPENAIIRVAAMYGTLTKPVAKSAKDGLVFAKPAFKRIGYGLKVGLGRKEENSVDLIMFRASDDISSIPFTDELEITPEENVVFGINTKQKISSRVNFSMEYAHSMLTRNKALGETNLNNFTFANNLGGLFTANISTEFNSAVKTAVDYSGDLFNLNLAYRRVDPGYRTLGSTFLNNDLEDISGGLSFQILQGKVGLNGNAGVQKNNLDDQLAEQVKRFIYSFGTNFSPSQNININANYSNFNSETVQSLIQTDITVDSIEFFQVTRNGTLNVNYNLGKGKSKKSMFVSSSIQDAKDSENNNSTFYNVNTGVQMSLISNLKTTFSFAYNRNESVLLQNTTLGPVVALGKNFLENKLNTSLSISYLNNYIDSDPSGNTLNLRFSGGFKLKKKQTLSLSAFYVDNERITDDGAKKFNEIRGSLNYSYRF